MFDLVDSKAFGDPMVPGPADANVYSADTAESESGTESSASSESTGPDEGASLADNEKDFESNLLSAEFEPTDKFDTLVQATHDQVESLEETFVLWKQRVDFLTTAARLKGVPRFRITLQWKIFPRPQPTVVPSPRGMPSRDQSLRPDTWNLLGTSGNVFDNPPAPIDSASTPHTGMLHSWNQSATARPVAGSEGTK